jgi:RNA polymerase sigma factor (sigma-70 family)
LSFIKHINNSAATDQELLIHYRQNGDTRVLAELYQRYMDLLYAVCLKYLKQPETAQDAVMAIFEELIVKLQKHEVSQFKGWVYRVAQNHCLMQLRSVRHIHMIDPDLVQLTDDVHLNGVFEKEENLNRLSKCMETLSAEQRTSIELFYLKEKCYREIADSTGSDWNKVRSLIQNGRRNLKICMEQKTTEDKLTNKQ